ncbi:MAG: ZIP family zinc transporter [Chloroflexota bacterium]|nr:ZIP family zinc transporter [Chloroflexia bacterium]MDQ3225992.1 ZIP family zinc transporter [Chloroflexota bacterium]
MLTALLYGVLASSGLLAGAAIGLVMSPPRRLVAAVVAFGSGVLVSALTFELMEEAFAEGSPAFTIGGFLLGAVIYVVADVLLERMAARSPRREGRDAQDVVPGAQQIPQTEKQATVSGMALLVGAALDGIPENAAIGIGLVADSRGLALVLLGAVFLGNLPASLSSAVGMREEGRSRRYVITAWSTVAVVCTLATVLGYVLLAGLSPNLIGAMLALAAGGILAMLADTMIPEAFQNGGPVVALATAVGFACAFLLSHVAG